MVREPVSYTHLDVYKRQLDEPEAIPFQKISEPTIAMQFMVNDSPLAGQEGKYVTSRHLRDRLFRELNTDVSLRVEAVSYTHLFCSLCGNY